MSGEQTELDLSSKSVNEQDHQFIACLLMFQEDWAPKLVSLNLAGCKIGDAGAKLIGSALKMSTAATLSFLDISNNKIGSDGAQHVAAAIPAMGAMTNLDLSNNNLTDEGAKHIAAAIPICE